MENLEQVNFDDFKNWSIEQQLCLFLDVIYELSTKCYDAVDHREPFIFSYLADAKDSLTRRLAIFVKNVDNSFDELEERNVYTFDKRYITEEDLTDEVKHVFNELYYDFNVLRKDMTRFNHDTETQSIKDYTEKFDKFSDLVYHSLNGSLF
jgi:hypothetical protein